MKYKVVVFTSTRAEYGLLRELCKLLESDDLFEFTLLVTGTHLEKEFGYTFSEIDKDCFSNLELIDLNLKKNKSPSEISAILIKKISIFFSSLKPDFFIVLGDRYEALGAVFAAFLKKISIIHLHGGEVSTGSLDNGFRNAISQLSNFHFTSHQSHTNNLLKMGIKRNKIFTVGPMVIDVINSHNALNKLDFMRKINYKFGDFNILISFHPESYSDDFGIEKLISIFSTVIHLNSNVLITYPNIDQGSQLIKEELIKFARIDPKKYFIIPSLGNHNYLSSLKLFDVIIGNSSSGIIEAPIIGIPPINIGNRQKGRTAFGKVFNLEGSKEELIDLLKTIAKNKNEYQLPRSLQIGSKSPSYEIIRILKQKQSNL